LYLFPGLPLEVKEKSDTKTVSLLKCSGQLGPERRLLREDNNGGIDGVIGIWAPAQIRLILIMFHIVSVLSAKHADECGLEKLEQSRDS
jgi:hypothetical protein